MMDTNQHNAGTSDASAIVGIDLGTTNSLVAVCDAAGPRVLAGPNGAVSLPSVVRFSTDSGRQEAIGELARREAVSHPETTIYSAKRLMGRGLDDLQTDAVSLSYPIVAGDHNTARVKIGKHVISPQEIAAVILAELKQWAQHALGQEISRAVVTVPAYFDDAQRQATRDAGRLAGLDVLRIINEPTAAALAYGLGVESKVSGTFSIDTKLNPEACASESEVQPASAICHPPSQTLAVYDLGGGTFDISILRLQETEDGKIDQVLSTAGDTQLGGDDVDQMLIDLAMREIREQFGQDLGFPPATRQALKQFAEATKIQLSTQDSATIEIALDDERTYRRTILRDEFEAMIIPWVDKTLVACRQAVSASGLSFSAIDRVVLVGGSTRIPAVRSAVEALFESEPYTALDPDQVVALGASVQAARLSGNASVAGGLLLDVIPLSLGIETMGGAVAKLITANSTIPARATEMYSTYAEGQTRVAINVYQGERELVNDCRLLGNFELTGIPPMPAGLPKINVTFLVDANGVLTVSAVEERSGRRAKTQIVPNHGLTRDEVQRIENESFTHAKQDMTAHRLIDLRLNAKLDIRNINKQLQRVGDQLEQAYRKEIDTHIAGVEKLIASPDEAVDADAFHQAMTDMDHATIRLAEIAIAQTLRGDDQ